MATHLVIDFLEVKDLSFKKINKQIKRFIKKDLEYKILGISKYLFNNGGFTSIFLLAESHLSYHYWPEKQFLSFDLYTCKNLSKEELDSIFFRIDNIFKNPKSFESRILNRHF